MRTRKGQATVEMVFILPLLIMLAGGMIFFVYVGLQDLKLQQAANLVARVEGQEKVSGGTSVAEINAENGFTSGEHPIDPNATINSTNFGIDPNTEVSVGSDGTLIDRMRALLKDFFGPGERNKVLLALPRTGINVDQVALFRQITPQIPILGRFFKSKGMPGTFMLHATAYGGEDPSMYALPRWGKDSTSKGRQEWRNLLQDADREKNATGGP